MKYGVGGGEREEEEEEDDGVECAGFVLTFCFFWLVMASPLFNIAMRDGALFMDTFSSFALRGLYLLSENEEAEEGEGVVIELFMRALLVLVFVN
jgi:hypothetical protein